MCTALFVVMGFTSATDKAVTAINKYSFFYHNILFIFVNKYVILMCACLHLQNFK